MLIYFATSFSTSGEKIPVAVTSAGEVIGFLWWVSAEALPIVCIIFLFTWVYDLHLFSVPFIYHLHLFLFDHLLISSGMLCLQVSNNLVFNKQMLEQININICSICHEWSEHISQDRNMTSTAFKLNFFAS